MERLNVSCAVDFWIMRNDGFLHLYLSFTFSLTFLNVFSIGPYKLNGVPLKRVNQKYAIATKTTVDVSGVNVSAVDDALFAREKTQKKDKLADLSAEPVKKSVSPQRQELQTKIDAELATKIAKVPMLDAYLKAKFSLSKADKPHALIF